MDITIIADNGGGLTLQIIDSSGSRYQHLYDSPEQCARDIRSALADGGAKGLGGNEAEDEDGEDNWLDPYDEDIRNGDYRLLSLADLDTASSWSNIRALSLALA